MARAPGLADARGFAEVNGASLYYEVAGDGGALVLCHCAPGDSTLWDPQFGPFAQTHRVVRFDARGFGRSTLPAGLFSFHEDLRGLLDFLGIERATVLGLSLGGRTALDLALSHPDRVRALVLANSGVSGSTLRPRPAGLADVEAALTRGDTADAAELMTRVWFDGPRSSDQVDARLRSWFVRTTRERFDRLRRGVPNQMAEFFVVRKHRRSGVGRSAAAECFRRFPGRWQIHEIAANEAAIAFWRAVIPGPYQETSNASGVTQRFEVQREHPVVR